jgi:hypothetical protein
MSDLDPIPYERFKEVNDKLAATVAELADAKKLLESAAVDRAALAKAKEDLTRVTQEISEKNLLLEKGKITASELETSVIALKTANRDMLRLRVAVKHGLPLDLADRLNGDDEAALSVDAVKVAAFLKPLTPGVPPPTNGGTPAAPLNIKEMTPGQIRENESKLLAAALKK